MREVMIWLGHERPPHKLRGDLLLVRKPQGRYGRMEGKDFLWLIVEGRDKELDALTLQEDTGWYRYQIPLVDLKRMIPNLDMGRLLDRQEEYQPLVDTDRERRFRRAQQIPFVLFDKREGRFLSGNRS